MWAGGLHPAHVLDDAEHTLLHDVRHGAGAFGHIGRRDLRGGDDDHLRVGNLLAQRHGHVTGAGGQVDEQVVQIAPVDV